MKKYALLFCFLFVTACVTSPTTNNNSLDQQKKPLVVMISIDGFRSDYMELYKPPTLSLLAHEGVWAQGMIPAFPSSTFPNHVTLVTGLSPGHHGIVANVFYDKKRKAAYRMMDVDVTSDGSWYHGEPIWMVAEKAGMRTATFFWVGSLSKIGGVDPTYLKKPYDGTIPNGARADKVIEWLQLPESQRPHFIGLYFSDVDTAGHQFGPESNEVKKAIDDIDGAIGKIVRYADQSGLPIQFVVVSDHGMQNISEQINLSQITDFKQCLVMDKGTTHLIYCEDPSEVERIYKDLKKKQKHYTVYKPAELPARWRFDDPDRRGDLILVADPGYYMTHQEIGAANTPQRINKATHGWDPEAPLMRALFIARGSMIQSGIQIAAFENIHVYPFVLELLSLQQKEKIDGDPKILHPLIKSAP